MSGITGIFLREGRNNCLDSIKRMNECLSHRGPDDRGIFFSDSIAMGHQMLYTTPESLNEKLPFYDDDAGLAITADARIDNRGELSKLLEIKNEELISDSTYILNAYKKWGEKCPEHLLGDFSFAIWDEEENKLFCARDHFGVKPFFYHISHDLFSFASELLTLLLLPDVQFKVNKNKIAHFITYLFEDREITFYENISRLPAAHSLTISKDGSKLEKYWKLNYKNRIKLESEYEYYDMFLKIFREAVKCRLRSAYGQGVLLSGGLDSSSIACTAREIKFKSRDRPLKTFSLIFKQTPQCDESFYINHVLKEGFFTSYMVDADQYSPIHNLDPILWNENGPIFAYNLYFNYLLYQTVNKKDVRVLLDGFGGDITVSYGSQLMIDLLRKREWIKLKREIGGTSKRLNRNIYKLWGFLFLTYLKQIFRGKLKQKPVIPLFTNCNIINREFIEKMKFTSQVNFYTKKQVHMDDKSLEYHYNALNSGMIQYALEEIDRLSAAFFIDSRFPFFDLRLIEFCLALPSNMKRLYGWDRYIVRQSMSGVIPSEIQWRKNKMNGGESVIKNFINLDKKYIELVIYENHEVIDEYIDIDSLKKAYNELRHNKDEQNFLDVWRATALGLWLTKFLEHKI